MVYEGGVRTPGLLIILVPERGRFGGLNGQKERSQRFIYQSTTTNEANASEESSILDQSTAFSIPGSILSDQHLEHYSALF